MNRLPYDTAVFYKGSERIGSVPLTVEPPDSFVWGTKEFGEAKWVAAGSIGNFEFKYVFEKALPRVADDGDESSEA